MHCEVKFRFAFINPGPLQMEGLSDIQMHITLQYLLLI